VVRAMSSTGKDVPHQSAQLYTKGKKVTVEQLKPGDLVFFETTGNGVSHVGIWIGKNQFIHASSVRGVCVQSLTGYYAEHLVGARRLT
jgi:murein DD-endopeptidase / murein LD-carboxypeptidase